VLPLVPKWCDPAWHLYVVCSPERDALQSRLAAAGIATLIHYPIPPHMQDAFAGLRMSPEMLPIARTLADQVVSLPIGPHLSEEDVQTVCEVITSPQDSAPR
jgi:dTDP-4-amino-4,6-dideoxygalactose transaminase